MTTASLPHPAVPDGRAQHAGARRGALVDLALPRSAARPRALDSGRGSVRQSSQDPQVQGA